MNYLEIRAKCLLSGNMIGFLRVVPAGRSPGQDGGPAQRPHGDHTTWPSAGNSCYGAPDDRFLVAQPIQDQHLRF